jgi:ketosteroid isomerase-like protein
MTPRIPAPSTPREVVLRFVELFSSRDADGLAALYRDDAVNHVHWPA